MEEVNFPRGGAERHVKEKNTSASKPSQRNRKRSSSKDFLFASSEPTKRKKRKKKKDTTNDESFVSQASSALPVGGGAVIQPSMTGSSIAKAPLIEALSFQKIDKGTKLLGMIREVAPDYAVVSLPSMLTGFIRRDIKSDVGLNRVVNVGMVLPVVVLRATAETISKKPNKSIMKRRIELSVSPSFLNAGLSMDALYEGRSVRGTIKSVEDHGCLVDLNIVGVGASGSFVKFDNIEGEFKLLTDTEDNADDNDDYIGDNDKEFKLNKGRVYDFTILSLPSKTKTGVSKVIQLKLETQNTRSKQITESASVISSKRESSPIQHTIRTLFPGILCNVSVEQFARNGLCVTFLGNVFRGSIDSGNLGVFNLDRSDKSKSGITDKHKKSGEMWWKDVFMGKLRTFPARLIAVDPVTKIVRLSILPHVLSLSIPRLNSFPPPGTVVENVRVVRLDPGIGALLAMPSLSDDEGNQSCAMDIEDDNSSHSTEIGLLSNETYRNCTIMKCAYVHISKALDNTNGRTPELLFNKKFSLNSTISKLRILSSTNWMDNISSCATADSIVSSAVLTHSDLKPGAIYKSVPIVANLEGGGILVQLGDTGLKGLVPAMHLFDKGTLGSTGSSGTDKNSYRNKIRREKFKVGNKIDVRCLVTDANEKKCILTAKSSLLNSDIEDPISTYSNIVNGRLATGFISRVTKQGLTITFYNNIFGRVSARKLAEELGVEDPTMNYKCGHVVKVRVEKCAELDSSRHEEEKNSVNSYRLDLSLDIASSADDNKVTSNLGKLIGSKLKSGMILPAKCMKIVELIPSRQHDEIETGYAVVSIRNKYLAAAFGEDLEGSFHCKLPYEHLLDVFENDVVKSADSIDALVKKVLKVGKKIAQEGLILQMPILGNLLSMPIVSLKTQLIESVKQSNNANNITQVPSSDFDVIVPSPSTALFMGAYVHGYCARLDSRYGAFIRFLDNLTGLVPKLKGGLDIPLFDTLLCKIVAIDVTTGKAPKILLKRMKSKRDRRSKVLASNEGATEMISDSVKIGDEVGDVRVDNINFARAAVTILGGKFRGSQVKARIHVTMAYPTNGYLESMPMIKKTKESSVSGEKDKITEHHPFHNWTLGAIIKKAICVSIDVKDGISYLELTNRISDQDELKTQKHLSPLLVQDPSHLKAGDIVSGIITSIAKQNKGIWVQICPGVTGFVPGLELIDDPVILNDMARYYKIGGRIKCCVVVDKSDKGQFKQVVKLSALTPTKIKNRKVVRNDVLIGRINGVVKQQRAPALMLEISGGLLARCDITELDETGDWSNLPLGCDNHNHKSDKRISYIKKSEAIQDIELAVHNGTEDADDPDDADDAPSNNRDLRRGGLYAHGSYVRCRVLSSSGSNVEVSLRESRIEGDMNDDAFPAEKDIVHAYVVTTNKKGCFLRLSRFVEGRVILKELSDSFLPDPISMFPPGRLVIGKVKTLREYQGKSGKIRKVIDLDMRESTLLEDKRKLKFEDIKENQKHTGVVTRIESYGVFVRLDNSEISGLAHLSECSDDYVKSLCALYNPGDLVKVLVIKVLRDKRQIGLSMKASHFEDDSDDSDEESSTSDVANLGNSMMKGSLSPRDDDNIDSDDDNFTSKLASKIESETTNVSKDDTDSSSTDSDSESSDESHDNSSDDDADGPEAMNTDVGFNWGTENTKESLSNENNDSSSDESDSDEDATNNRKSHKGRKKLAEQKHEGKRISDIEQRMADGTADENPETIADFERLLASNSNSSENWIRFMAYYLSLADIEGARNVANRAFDRIDYRQEDEKLNVWTALIALESKYGTPKNFDDVILRASQHNNPKQIYLRACEMLESKIDASNGDESTKEQADQMFTKMCKKFKSKKTVWISHFKYLVRSARHNEAHNLRKKSLTSLPAYKHIETMSKFAQLEYEFGSSERARTIFDALIEKHPKRMDLLFVYIDKETKYGEIDAARRLFEKRINPPNGQKRMKYSDKQMKSLFKKWYRMEDMHGDNERREHVKIAAKEYVERSSSAQ